MRTSLLTMSVLLAAGCASPGRPQAGPGAARVGAPTAPMDPALAAAPPTAPGAVQLPDRITLPASYRVILLDGHLTLVREADSQALDGAPASLRIITGEIARGELAYQPGLLPQELAAEVAANRESAARMDNAMEAVLQRSRELSAQSMEVERESRRLEQLLSAAQSRVKELEDAARPGQAAAAPPKPAEGDARE
jgi:hypothetical protein